MFNWYPHFVCRKDEYKFPKILKTFIQEIIILYEEKHETKSYLHTTILTFNGRKKNYPSKLPITFFRQCRVFRGNTITVFVLK